MKNIMRSSLLTVLVVFNASAEPQMLTKFRDGLHGCAATNLPVVGGYLQKADDAVYAVAKKVAPDNELVQSVAKEAVGAHMPVSVNKLNMAHAINAFVFNEDGVSYLFPTGKTVVFGGIAPTPARLSIFASIAGLNETVEKKIGKNKLLFVKHAFAIAFLNGEVSRDSLLNYAQSQANESGAKLLFGRFFSNTSGKTYWNGFAAEGISSGLTTIAENKDASIKNRFWARATMMALQAASMTKTVGGQIVLDKDNSFKNAFAATALVKNAYELRNLYKEHKQQAERA